MDRTALAFDPRDAAFRADPYAVYDLLRAAAPAFFWEPWGIWFLTRYEDCNALLRDPRLVHGEMNGSPPAEQRALFDLQRNWLLFKNPPDHTRLRRLVHAAFTPRMVERMRGQIAATTDRLLDRIAEAGRADLIADLAFPLPVTVIAGLLGVPATDQAQFHVWSRALAHSLDLTEDPAVYSRASSAAAELTAYLREIAAERRRAPQDDLLSALLAVEDQGGTLSEAELYATVTLLLVAGHETTVNLIGNGVLALLRHPDQLRELRAEPGLIKTAVEELLRFDSPVQATTRIAREDLVVCGQTVRAGQEVSLMLGAANHDPARFSDPHRLDLRRDPNPHLAFGSGIHYCLGAPLARLEGQIAIGRLVERMPRLALATDQPVYAGNFVLRGLTELPITV